MNVRNVKKGKSHHSLIKRPSFDILHNDQYFSFILKHSLNFDYVMMIELAHDIKFTSQLVASLHAQRLAV